MLDHIIFDLNYGYKAMHNDSITIPHPVILGDGMHFYCLSTSPAADGTRAEDWYKLSFAGVQPVCSCRAWRRDTGCKHVSIVAAQVDDLCKARTARWEAARQARKNAAQEGRAA